MADQTTYSADTLLLSEINQSVKERYAEIPQVQFIYQLVDAAHIRFWIFSNEPKYDDALMDELIDREYDLLKAYRGTELEFRYIPLALCDNPTDVVDRDATLLYQV